MKKRDKAGKKAKDLKKTRKTTVSAKDEAKSQTAVKKKPSKRRPVGRPKTTTRTKPTTGKPKPKPEAPVEKKSPTAFSPSETRKEFTVLRRFGAALKSGGHNEALGELNTFVGMFSVDATGIGELTRQWAVVKKATPTELKPTFDFRQSSLLAGAKLAQQEMKVLASIRTSLAKGVEAHVKALGTGKGKRRSRKA